MNIWKDPRVELPANESDVIVLEQNKITLTLCSFYNNRFEDKATEQWYSRQASEDIYKWCYEEDLIKQAEGQ